MSVFSRPIPPKCVNTASKCPLLARPHGLFLAQWMNIFHFCEKEVKAHKICFKISQNNFFDLGPPPYTLNDPIASLSHFRDVQLQRENYEKPISSQKNRLKRLKIGTWYPCSTFKKRCAGIFKIFIFRSVLGSRNSQKHQKSHFLDF